MHGALTVARQVAVAHKAWLPFCAPLVGLRHAVAIPVSADREGLVACEREVASTGERHAAGGDQSAIRSERRRVGCAVVPEARRDATGGAEEWIERPVGIVACERERTRPAGRGATDGDQLTVRLEDERRYFRITGERGDDAALAAEEGIEAAVGIVAREGEPRGHTVRGAAGGDDLPVGLEDERQRLGVSREAGDDTAAGGRRRDRASRRCRSVRARNCSACRSTRAPP